MRIGILTHTQGWGGAEVHTVQLVRTLMARGHSVVLVQLGHNQYGLAHPRHHTDAELVEIPLKHRLADTGFTDFFRALRPLRLDVCVCAKGALTVGNWQLDIAARLTSSRYITIEHLIADTMPARVTGRYLAGLVPGLGLWWYRKWLSNHARSFFPQVAVCVSEAVRSRLIESYLFPATRTITVRNGVDTDACRRSDEARTRLRKTWGIADGDLVVGAIGRFHRQKAFDVLLPLFRQLLDSHEGPALHLVLAGEGEEESALVRQIASLGLGERVRLLPFTNTPVDTYSAIDVFVLPSRSEGLPLALLEAMACECYPIATSVGGVAEVLTRAEEGRLVVAGDANGFLTALREVCALPLTELASLARGSRHRVVSEFEVRTQMDRLATIIDEPGPRPKAGSVGERALSGIH